MIKSEWSAIYTSLLTLRGLFCSFAADEHLDEEDMDAGPETVTVTVYLDGEGATLVFLDSPSEVLHE